MVCEAKRADDLLESDTIAGGEKLALGELRDTGDIATLRDRHFFRRRDLCTCI
jgi:hypothetical protein